MSDIFSTLRASNRIEFNEILRVGGVTLSFVSPANFYAWYRAGFKPSGIDHLFIDSISLVRLMNYLDRPECYRRRSFDFTSLAGELFSYALQSATPVLLIGATKGKNADARANLVARYPGLRVEGVQGYLTPSEVARQIADFAARHPGGLVLLSLGAPKQDVILKAVSGRFKNLTVMTSGGFVEQVSEALDYYPALIDWLNLRWLYRAYRLRSFAKVIKVFFGLALLARQFCARQQPTPRP